jgi:SSS family solute:Na+ symporter
MAPLDWIIVVIFLLAVVAVGLLLSRKASGSLEDYFVSGRNLPWWLAGTSILATSFSSDTPLHVTRVIREAGLGGAWFYWSGIFSGLVVAFFFARLWRRAAIVTDAELIELRYSGASAAALRGTVALFRSVVLELITLAWVILGMTKIVSAVLDLPPGATLNLPLVGPVPSDAAIVVGLVALALLYATTSGLWGVVVTDFIEFIVALGGAVLLAVLAVRKAGGIQGLRQGLAASPLGEGALDFVPAPSDLGVPAVTLVVYMGIQWWANTEIDGSGKRAQRFLACKNERHALASGVWNMAVQWLLRSWPWYLTALASAVLYPQLADHEAAYPTMIADLMPVGFKGLMVAAFLAAFLSTIDSQLNLSASYLVNDLYRRFLAKDRPDKHYVNAARLMVLGVAAVATVIALALPSVLDAFRFKMELMAGLGLIYLLRWFWWRVNAFSELCALSAGVITALLLHTSLSPLAGPGTETFAWRLIVIVAVAAAAGLLATLVAPTEPMDHLRAFYRRVSPPAFGWGPVAAAEGSAAASTVQPATVGQFALAVVAVFSGMFGLGKLLLGEPGLGAGLMLLAVVTGGTMLKWALGQRAL